MKYIYHHLGLGDCIMCNGMVRHYAKLDSVTTFAKAHYVDTVRYMYRDLDNVTVLSMDDSEVISFISTKNQADVCIAGHMGRDWNTKYENQKVPVDDQIKLDWMFYNQVNLSLDIKWNAFYVDRDKTKELELFDRLGLKEGKYVFIHDTSKQPYPEYNRGGVGGEIDRAYIQDKSLPVIIPENIKFNIFDYSYIIEHAAELHMINSSFYNLADLIPTNGKLYYHIYPRPYDCITSKKPWVKLWGDVPH